MPDPQLHSHVVVLGARADGRAVRGGRLAGAVSLGAGERRVVSRGAGVRAAASSGCEVRRRDGPGRPVLRGAGVPAELAERWSARTEDIARAAREFRTRYGREPRAGELGCDDGRDARHEDAARAGRRGRGVAGGRRGARPDRASRRRACSTEQDAQRPRAGATSAAKLLTRLDARDGRWSRERDLTRARMSWRPGDARPREARRRSSADLTRAGELVELEGGMWTTRELRELEQRTLALAETARSERAAPVTPSRRCARRAGAAREIGGAAERRAARRAARRSRARAA